MYQTVPTGEWIRTFDILFAMEDLSEHAIRVNCPHCDIKSQAFRYSLEDTGNFFIVCDSHAIVEGHILIIPKQHFSCIGAYTKNIYEEFLKIDKKVSNFLLKNYKAVSSFEHGIWGQTVFHSHVHYLPYQRKPEDIVSENKFSEISDLKDLNYLLRKNGGYLFFSMNNKMYSVDSSISAPRFFRDRYARVFKRPERGNWKNIHNKEEFEKEIKMENLAVQTKWKSFFE